MTSDLKKTINTDFFTATPEWGSVMSCSIGSNLTKQFPRVVRKIIRSNWTVSAVEMTPVRYEKRISNKGRVRLISLVVVVVLCVPILPSALRLLLPKLPVEDGGVGALRRVRPGFGAGVREDEEEETNRRASFIKKYCAFIKTSCNSTRSLYSKVNLSLIVFNSCKCVSYCSISASKDFKIFLFPFLLDPSRPREAFRDGGDRDITLSSFVKKLSIVPGESRSRPNLSNSVAKYRNLRSTSSQRFTIDTYRR